MLPNDWICRITDVDGGDDSGDRCGENEFGGCCFGRAASKGDDDRERGLQTEQDATLAAVEPSFTGIRSS